ncbi:hypothetical protein Pmani_022308 [Petrolisthes manimaculis]|uniref:EGF-like domain-containing protein n=1 Tax=Petrolisthes manimaculis TaxID=1843537 RepID=A0AAE1PCA8_9EUCA|nr:hypothetical protein Pmani_022308 [Petrolisthes manimaculis]
MVVTALLVVTTSGQVHTTADEYPTPDIELSPSQLNVTELDTEYDNEGEESTAVEYNPSMTQGEGGDNMTPSSTTTPTGTTTGGNNKDMTTTTTSVGGNDRTTPVPNESMTNVAENNNNNGTTNPDSPTQTSSSSVADNNTTTDTEPNQTTHTITTTTTPLTGATNTSTTNTTTTATTTTTVDGTNATTTNTNNNNTTTITPSTTNTTIAGGNGNNNTTETNTTMAPVTTTTTTTTTVSPCGENARRSEGNQCVCDAGWTTDPADNPPPTNNNNNTNTNNNTNNNTNTSNNTTTTTPNNNNNTTSTNNNTTTNNTSTNNTTTTTKRITNTTTTTTNNNNNATADTTSISCPCPDLCLAGERRGVSCPDEAQCYQMTCNTMGCKCSNHRVYEPVGMTCVDPCAYYGSSVCGVGKGFMCMSSPSEPLGYSCDCMQGYKMEGDHCKDIDECYNGPCKENERCVNLPGETTPACPCLPGYIKNNMDYCYHEFNVSYYELTNLKEFDIIVNHFPNPTTPSQHPSPHHNTPFSSPQHPLLLTTTPPSPHHNTPFSSPQHPLLLTTTPPSPHHNTPFSSPLHPLLLTTTPPSPHHNTPFSSPQHPLLLTTTPPSPHHYTPSPHHYTPFSSPQHPLLLTTTPPSPHHNTPFSSPQHPLLLTTTPPSPHHNTPFSSPQHPLLLTTTPPSPHHNTPFSSPQHPLLLTTTPPSPHHNTPFSSPLHPLLLTTTPPSPHHNTPFSSPLHPLLLTTTPPSPHHYTPFSSFPLPDVNECLNPSLHDCDQVCVDGIPPINYTCTCHEGFTWDNTTRRCVIDNSTRACNCSDAERSVCYKGDDGQQQCYPRPGFIKSGDEFVDKKECDNKTEVGAWCWRNGMCVEGVGGSSCVCRQGYTNQTNNYGICERGSSQKTSCNSTSCPPPLTCGFNHLWTPECVCGIQCKDLIGSNLTSSVYQGTVLLHTASFNAYMTSLLSNSTTLRASQKVTQAFGPYFGLDNIEVVSVTPQAATTTTTTSTTTTTRRKKREVMTSGQLLLVTFLVATQQRPNMTPQEVMRLVSSECMDVIDTTDLCTLYGGLVVKKNSITVTERDPCDSQPCPSSANQVCEKVDEAPGRFECSCVPGYSIVQVEGFMGYCQDVDECSVKEDLCEEEHVCINTPGSFVCRYNPGVTKASAQTMREMAISFGILFFLTLFLTIGLLYLLMKKNKRERELVPMTTTTTTNASYENDSYK